MSEYNILKAVEYSKTSAVWRKTHAFDDLVSKGWWLQPKYDGCFGMAVIKPNREDSRMLSRTGEDYTISCQHILEEIHECCEATGMYPIDNGFVILGEVWHLTDKFPKISGDFRRQRPSPHLCFVANDILPHGLVTPLVYKDRHASLLELVGPVAHMDEVTQVGCVSSGAFGYEAWTATEFAVHLKTLHDKGQGGYDGAILRDPNAGYTIGDAKLGQIIKVKPVLSLDLECTAADIEPGAKTGRDVLTIAVKYQGEHTWVGSGIPHDLTMDDVLGKIVEIECMGLTEDGKLREPRFKGIRHDKLKAD